MTDMDSAELLLAHLQSIGADIHNGALPVIRRDIAAAIAAAVQAEREACAKLASNAAYDMAYTADAHCCAMAGKDIAAAIRARNGAAASK